MYQMYDSFIRSIKYSHLRDKVQIRFIDAITDDIDNYPNVVDLLKKGYKLPFVAVNGVVKIYGGIPYNAIYSEIEKAYNSDTAKLKSITVD